MVTALALASGLFWTLTYVLVIRQGLADRTYGMPLVALCANLAWEFIFSVVRPHHGVQHGVDIAWLCLDLGIAYTALRYGPREFPYLSRPAFYAGLAGTFALSYLGVDLVCRQFDGGRGGYAAFGQNLMIPEPKNRIAVLIQPRGPTLISRGFGMLAAIDFDNQAFFAAQKFHAAFSERI